MAIRLKNPPPAPPPTPDTAPASTRPTRAPTTASPQASESTTPPTPPDSRDLTPFPGTSTLWKQRIVAWGLLPGAVSSIPLPTGGMKAVIGCTFDKLTPQEVAALYPAGESRSMLLSMQYEIWGTVRETRYDAASKKHTIVICGESKSVGC